jgi:hypothetical protein
VKQWKEKTVERKKSEGNFDPKYKNVTDAFSRRLKEFYNKDEYLQTYSHTGTTAGTLLKENYEVEAKERNEKLKTLTAAERKKLELNPKLDQDEIKGLTRKFSFYEKNSNNTKFDPLKSTRDARVNNLESNIFNIDESKLKRNKSFHVKRDFIDNLDKMEKSEELKVNNKIEGKSIAKRDKTPFHKKTKTNVANNFSWLKVNTELTFDKEKE